MNINEYNFIDFKQTSSRFSVVISLGKSNRFGFSSGLIKKYKLQDKEAALISYDKEKKAIAFRFFNEKSKGMVSFTHMKEGGAYINAKAFLSNFDIDAEKYSNRYEPKEVVVNNENIFIIELTTKK